MARVLSDSPHLGVSRHGLVERIYTDAREHELGDGRTAPTPWQGRFSRYERRDGPLIPMAGDVEWLLPDEPRAYWRGEISAVAFAPCWAPTRPDVCEMRVWIRRAAHPMWRAL